MFHTRKHNPLAEPACKPVAEAHNKDAYSNEVFVRKDTWLQRNTLVDERCDRQNVAFKELKDGQEAIERKISATLVFAIVTLAGVVTALVMGK